MFQVAAYARVSTDEQAEQGISIPSQKSRLLAYIQSQGWDLYDFYIDDGYSGKDLNRPDIKRLISDVKEGKLKAVVVIKLDRLSRRQKDVLYLLEDVLEPSAVGFKSVSEPFDTTTPFGKAAIGMMAVFAQLERETIVERVKDAKKEAAQQGRFMGGPIPYGYNHNPATKSVSIDAAEATIVRFIFEQYRTSCRGYQYIADLLNERRTPPPGTAGNWQRSTIKAMLHNPFYAGFIQHKGNLHNGKHSAIISAQEYFDAQGLQTSRNTYNSDSKSCLLTGLVYCTECGAKMRLKKVWKNPRNPIEKVAYYVCYSQDGSSREMIKDITCRSGYKRAVELEAAVIEQLMNYSSNTTLLEEVSAQVMKSTDHALATKALSQLKKEVDGIQKKVDKWYDAFENNLISAADFTSRVKNLRERKTYLETQILSYTDNITTATIKATTRQELIKDLSNFKNSWDKASPEERHSILSNMISSVHVSKENEIEIIFF
ncbi:integrase [Sporomusaceae bacterium FL31]|nr:integrase [Sporomusaceae bacterium FL31]GCE33342.1 integrase [Sporomusaceae bacterium]